MATIIPFPHRAPDLSWRPLVAARVAAWRRRHPLMRRAYRAARALVALFLVAA